MDLIINCSWSGLNLTQVKKNEGCFQRGVHRVQILLCQSDALTSASYLFNEAQKAANSSLLIPKSIENKLFILPLVLNLACHHTKLSKNPKLKRTFLWINSCLTSFLQVSSLVSSIALIYFGKRVAGGIACALIVYGYMQRRNWFSYNFHENYFEFPMEITVNSLKILLGNLPSKMTGLFFLSTKIESKRRYYRKMERLKNQKQVEPFTLSYKEFSDRLYYNRTHVLEATPAQTKYAIPPPPDEDLKQILTFFKEIPWENAIYKNLCSHIVPNDDHWEENYSDKRSDQDLHNYVKNGLNELVEILERRHSRSGEFKNIHSLEARMKHIIYALRACTEMEKATVLIQLGLGSYYCPAGYRRVIGGCYKDLCDSKADTIQEKLQQVIDFSKKHLALTQIAKPYSKMPKVSKFFFNPMVRQHDYDTLMALIGDQFLLGDVEDVEDDETLIVLPFVEDIIRLALKHQISDFRKEYTSDYILEETKVAFKNGQIPWELFEEWFVKHIKDLVDMKRFQQNLMDIESLRGNKRPKKPPKLTRENAIEWVRNYIYYETRDLQGKPTGAIHDDYLEYLLLKEGALILSPKIPNDS